MANATRCSLQEIVNYYHRKGKKETKVMENRNPIYNKKIDPNKQVNMGVVDIDKVDVRNIAGNISSAFDSGFFEKEEK